MMKKLLNNLTGGSLRVLTLLALVIALGASAHAADYTVYDGANPGTWTENAATNGWIQVGDEFTLVTDKGTNNNALPSPAKNGHMRIYQNSSLSITSKSVNITEVIFTCTAQDRTSEMTVPEGWNQSVDAAKCLITLTNPVGSKELTVTATTKQIRVSKIVVVGEAGVELGEIQYDGAEANNQELQAVGGEEFVFTAVNATSMSIEVNGADKNVFEGNAATWIAPKVTEETLYTLTITATKNGESAVKEASVKITVKPAAACGAVIFNPAAGEVVKGSYVTITCENAVSIKYWFDENAAESVTVKIEEANIPINQACTLHAVGINADGVEGVENAAVYTVKEATAAFLDFTNAEIIYSAYNGTDLEAGGQGTTNNSLDGKKLMLNGVGFAFAVESGNAPRWWQNTVNQGGKTELRFYNGNTLTITAPEGCVLSKISFDVRTGSVNMTSNTGNIADGVWTPSTSAAETIARVAGADVTSVVFTGNKTSNIYSISVEFNASTGIAGIEAEDGEAVYYNLQGVRVENPVKGLYIRVANGKSEKVIM